MDVQAEILLAFVSYARKELEPHGYMILSSQDLAMPVAVRQFTSKEKYQSEVVTRVSVLFNGVRMFVQDRGDAADPDAIHRDNTHLAYVLGRTLATAIADGIIPKVLNQLNALSPDAKSC